MKTKLITILILTSSIFIANVAFSQKPLDISKPYKMKPRGIIQKPIEKVTPQRHIRPERVINKGTRDHCDGGFVDDCSGSEYCEDCLYDFTPYGSECCDTAWEEYGIDCNTLESNYNWDCEGCNCPGDEPTECGDGNCSWNENEDTCPEDCANGGCPAGYIVDCQPWDDSCCPESWIGDGYGDCENDNCGYFCCDLSCYACDGGDCDCDEPTCEEQGLVSCWDYSCAETEIDCPAFECPIGYVPDCIEYGECCHEVLIGNDNCHNGGTFTSCDLTCYDCDGGDCECDEQSCEDQGLITCPDGDCAGYLQLCSDCCPEGYVENCDSPGCVSNFWPCLPEDWFGDEYADCEDTGWSLQCYHDDGGACANLNPWDGCHEDDIEDCSGDGDCCPIDWLGDGWPDCADQPWGCDLTCYENDGGDCGNSLCYPLYDTNQDGELNILDVVQVVNFILGDGYLSCSIDYDNDGTMNILDIVVMVNLILEN